GLGARAAAGADHLRVDAAALLGAGHLPPRGLCARAGADAAGHARRGLHALADPAVHRAAGGGDGAALGGRHERAVLPGRRPGAGPGVPVARLAPDGPAGRVLPDAGVQLLGGLPDGAVRVPADGPLAAAPAAARAAVRAAPGRLSPAA